MLTVSVRSVLAIGLLGFLAWRWIGFGSSLPQLINVERQVQTTTRPIDQIRVGERVLTSRTVGSHEEPLWQSWMQLSAVMAVKQTESSGDREFLRIELLRPEKWLRDRVRLECNQSSVYASPLFVCLKPRFKPIRGIFLDLIEQQDAFDSAGIEPSSIVIDLDLPEMGAVGVASVTEIKPCPVVTEGPGNVVTATFAHPATNQVLNVTFAGDGTPEQSESICVTENHPFWSVDHNEFVSIGKLSVGQLVQTYAGDTHRIVSKLARPGPHTVYNLEVYAEHAYCVGHSGLLVHNDCLRDDWENTPRDRPSLSMQEARENGLNPVSGKSALMTGRSLSMSEEHHIASPYRKDLAKLFKSLGLNIRTHRQNLVDLDFHTGPHLPIYHEFVYRVLWKSIAGKEGADRLSSFNDALEKLGRFLNRHKAIPNHFRL